MNVLKHRETSNPTPAATAAAAAAGAAAAGLRRLGDRAPKSFASHTRLPPPCTQVIGVVVAETEPLARRAAKAVSVEYEDLPAIISIEDAIEVGSYYEQYHGDSLVSGDLEAGFAGR